jgi:hypothetical protein
VNETDEQGSKDMTNRNGFAPVPTDPDDGLVWVIVAEEPSGTHVEVFTERPRTVANGGDADCWPPAYKVYEGYPDGGDSVCIESHPPGPARARCGHRLWRDEHCGVGACSNFIGRHDPLHHATGADR